MNVQLSEFPFDLSEFDFSGISKRIRESENWSTYRLAREIDTSQSTIARIELRKTNPKKGVRERLFDLYTSSLFDQICSVDPIAKPSSKQEYLDLKAGNPKLFQQITTAMEGHLKRDPDNAKYFMFLGFWYSQCVQHNRRKLTFKVGDEIRTTDDGESTPLGPAPPIAFSE
jgi:transcriptional regulator with XRE-family HTH domain|tara:strand:+ start:204 stop:716 length:513 start_codon:yes stop_codon:yes gene_type:complete